MQFKQIGNGYILKIEKGEELIRALTVFCEENGVSSGSVSGIGGTDDVVIKYYDLEKEAYCSKCFSGKNYEIISLTGNISLVQGKPFAHLHVALGDSDYHVLGGHLESAVIDITWEITIHMTDDVLNRKFDEELKLNLLDF